MRFVFVDEGHPEPNNEESPSTRFLVVGSVMIDSESVAEFTRNVENIRGQFGFNPTDSLKFSPNDRPKQVSKEAHIAAKSAVLEIANSLGVKAILYCALHKIIDHQGMDTYLNWALDAQLTKIQQFSTETGDGKAFYCFFDRHSRKQFGPYIAEKFQKRNQQLRDGFNTPDFVGAGSVWDGTSHLSSLCDIVTGSFTYIINQPERDKAGKELIKKIKPLVWGSLQENGTLSVLGRGLLFRPEVDTIRHSEYVKYYEEARDRVISWANEANG